MDDVELAIPSPVTAFARHVRAAGIPVGPDGTIAFAKALAELGATNEQSLYWAGRLTLVKRTDHVDVYDRAFMSFIRGDEETVPSKETSSRGPGHKENAGLDSSGTSIATGDTEASVSLASSVEILKNKNFEKISAEEMNELKDLIGSIAASPPERITRRTRPAPSGHTLDLRRMLADSMRTEGEPVTRKWQRRQRKPRRVVFLLDISGSMKAYSRTLLHFAYAVRKRHPRTEIFCFGSSVTRVTDELARESVDVALDAAAVAIADWEGGTRIAESIESFISRWGRRGVARSSVVIVCSDGLERGDPSELRDQMARLRCLCHRIVWLNPLKGSPTYEPLARGMSAALPFIDRFLPGHNLTSLYELATALPSLRDRR